MIKYFIEVSKNSSKIGNVLCAPANERIWHWTILNDLRKGDVVYHISTEERPPLLIGKSKVKTSAKERKLVLKEYPKYQKSWEVKLFNYKKLRIPILFDKEFSSRLRKAYFKVNKSPFNIHYSLNQIYCCEMDVKLRNFLEREIKIKNG